ncbi:MAG: AMP-binding protein [Deferrisomatales bacterium]|nr:AMP-binding protein [Deferrisomatales bacterium]
MPNHAEYWNSTLETLDPSRTRDLQFLKFKRLLARSYENSRLYRRKYDAAGLTPADVRTWDDVAKVPLLTKDDYRCQGKDPFPYGDTLCVPLEDVTVFHQTSGTTGTPVYQPDTWADWEWWSECWATIMWAQGFRPSDRLFLPFGYNIFVAYWAGHYAAEKIGCEVVPGGVLGTRERLMKMKELAVTAFMATPTYVLGMAETARKDLGIDPREFGIQKILCAGEPGALVPSTKARMQEAWGCKVCDHVGATEVGAWSFECSHQPGGLHINEALFLVELLALDSDTPVTEPGVPGRIVITSLDRVAQPCIRFDTKDVSMWAADRCSCGRTWKILDKGVHGRVDHITKVKGVLFSPVTVEEVVRSFAELDGEFEVIVEKQGDLDSIRLRVETPPDLSAEGTAGLLTKLGSALRWKTQLNITIEPQPYGSLPRYEVKAKRFHDRRGK